LDSKGVFVFFVITQHHFHSNASSKIGTLAIDHGPMLFWLKAAHVFAAKNATIFSIAIFPLSTSRIEELVA
jgi:hypothetical protein